jgi:hypothetical protein
LKQQMEKTDNKIDKLLEERKWKNGNNSSINNNSNNVSCWANN